MRKQSQMRKHKRLTCVAQKANIYIKKFQFA